MGRYFGRYTVNERYDVKEVLYGLHELYKALKDQEDIEYEIQSLKRAIRIVKKYMPRFAKEGCCPVCGHYVDNYFCPECGQHIGWRHHSRPSDPNVDGYSIYNKNKGMNLYGKERKEIENYIRVHGVSWVVDRLSQADFECQPVTEQEIRDWAKETEYQYIQQVNLRGGRWKREQEEKENTKKEPGN